MTVLIALPGHEEHARRLGSRLDLEVVVPELRRFPDGEVYVRYGRERFDGDVAIVGNLHGDAFLTVAFLAGTARDLGAQRVGLVAPYLAYMRQDSVFKPGEGLTARHFGRLVSSIADWMVTVDPHLHRLDSLDRVYSIPTTIARAAPAIADWITAEIEHPVLIGPDAESAQWVSAVAACCRAPYLILEKTRRGDRDVSISSPQPSGLLRAPAEPGLAITAPDGPWNGHTPVVIDDIVSTGKTMVEATRQLCAAGSAAPQCIAIHAVFADAVHDELVAAGARGIVTCNTIAHASNRICISEGLASALRAQLG